MITINIKLAFASLRSAKWRAFLTMFAVMIGVAGYVIVSTTVDGIKTSISNEISGLDGNLVSISSGKLVSYDEQGNKSYNISAGIGQSTLTEADLEDVLSIEGADLVAPQVLLEGNVERYGNQLEGGLIIATNEDYISVFDQKIEAGSFFSEEDDGKFAVIGSGVVDDLYNGSFIPGTTIQIRGVDYTVIGQIEEQAASLSSLSGLNPNNVVFFPAKQIVDLTGSPPLYNSISVSLESVDQVDSFVEQAETKILENHKNGQDDFTILKEDELIEVNEDILNVVKSASQAMSYVMISVGGIVILLIMLITVSERTREIGIRKSIGATNGNIMVQFITEAIVISWIGSVLGIALAFLIGFVINAQLGISPTYSAETLAAVVFISTWVGAIFGLIPARAAAKKDPIEALRHE